jgi:DNA helicase-2/ATP-dependent DNA helicase PcrA
LKDLTPSQRQAVIHKDGPCLVIAGAGTGKTTVISERIAYLIREGGVPAEAITALTFTDKAAQEMEERVDTLLPYGMTGTTISTFHSFCGDILKRHAFLIGVDPASKLLTPADEISFLRLHLADLSTRVYRPSKNPVEFLRMLVSFISKVRDENLSPQQVLDHAEEKVAHSGNAGEREEAEKLRELATIYSEVETLYKDHSVLAYGDLLYYAAQILREHPSAQALESKRCKYLLIDEFQDTNSIQNEIARLLAAPANNIMAVGDDDQAIYSFRGANLANILNFSTTYPGTTVIALIDNFRSNQEILDAAYRLIQFNNPERLETKENIDKRLVSHMDPVTDAVQHLHFERGIFEYQAIAQEIARLLDSDDYQPENIAILVRSRTHIHGIQNALENLGIPFQFAGDTQFFHQPAVRIALGHLRFLADCHDDLNLFYTLSQPPFSVDEQILQTHLNAARYANSSLYSQLGASRMEDLPPELVSTLEYLGKRFAKGSVQLPSQALLDFLHSSGWYGSITDKNDQATAEMLATFYQEVLTYESVHRPTTVQEYVQHMDLLLATDEEITLQGGAEKYVQGVQLLTIHKSKGLEFKAVFVMNMVQGRFPSRNFSDSFPFPYELTTLTENENNLAEERRLAYVAMTRAKERLFLTSSELYEERKTKAKVSPFVLEALSVSQPAQTIAAKIPGNSIKTPLEDKPKPDRTVEKPLHFSASSLETYETCPKRYHYQYVLQLRVPNSHLSNFGTSVHETLKSWFLTRNHPDALSLEEQYAKQWISGGYESKKQERERYDEGLAKILEYCSNVDESTEPVALEFSCKARLPDGTSISGKIDRIDRNGPDKRVTIIDYKTSDKPKKRKDLVADLPLSVYTLALEQRGYEVAEVELHYLMVGEKVSLTKEELSVAAALSKAEGLIAAIHASLDNQEFIAKPEKFSCSFCDYRDICPFRYGKIR